MTLSTIPIVYCWLHYGSGWMKDYFNIIVVLRIRLFILQERRIHMIPEGAEDYDGKFFKGNPQFKNS